MTLIGIRLLACVFCSLMAAPALAQLRVDSLSDTQGDATLKFPLLKGGDAAATQRINTWLQVTQLKKLPGKYRQSPFEDIVPAPGSSQGVDALDYAVKGNTPGYLSLQIQGEYMGASANPFSLSYNFDIKSGELIALQDVFTAPGLTQLTERVREKRLKRLDSYLGKAKRDGSVDDGGDALKMYSACRERFAADDLSTNQLNLSKNTLTLIADCATTHYQQ
ncbi:hypothetical protein, partial [Dyella silvatica]|uniref:hypothetical protein n=1 Tax=Dyella silvatica TaxID=2992128 RepID=UPI00224E65E8